MIPSGEVKASNYSNKVFFASSEIAIAFDAIPIERKGICVFNPGENDLYLGGNDVNDENYIEVVPSGKIVLSDKFDSAEIYCTNLGSTTIINGSDYY